MFAVLDAGNWADRPPILLERESLRGDTPPSRESRENIAATIRAGASSGGAGRYDSNGKLTAPIAPTISARSNGGGGLGSDFDIDGGLIVAQSTMSPPPAIPHPHVAMSLNAGAIGRQDAESETLIPTIGGAFDVGVTLLGGGHSNNPLDENIIQIPFDTTQITSAENGCNPQPGAPCHPLAAGAHPPAIAFHGSQDPDSSGDITHPIGRNQGQEVCIAFNPVQEGMGLSDIAAPIGASCGGGNQGAVATQPYTLAIRGRGDSHDLEYRQDGVANALLTPNGGRAGIGVGAIATPSSHTTQPPIAWTEELTASIDVAGTVQRGGGGGRHDGVMLDCLSVRRLTPRECERLQGFPDDYTHIPWRAYRAAIRKEGGMVVTFLRASYESILAGLGKSLREPAGEECPDGPRYKALGNSMAVPVMRWIGKRIDAAAKFGN